MIRMLMFILLNSLGFYIEPPKARLGKKYSLKEKIEIFAYNHEYELLLIITILMIITFALVVFTVVPPMDLWNNHFEEMI